MLLNLLEEDRMGPGASLVSPIPRVPAEPGLGSTGFATVLTLGTAPCCSGGTPENAIAKSCVELGQNKSSLTQALQVVFQAEPLEGSLGALQ